MSYVLTKRGSVWHYRFQIGGLRIQRSTREIVKRKADAVAEKAYTHAKMAARNEQPIPTLSQLIESWLDLHRNTASNHHIRSVDTFKRLHLYKLGKVRIDGLTTEMVEQTRLRHLKTHSRASTNHWLTILKLLVNWAVKREVILFLPWKVPLLKLQKKPRATLSITQSSAWLYAIDHYRAGAPHISIACRLMFGLGLRESETLTARWEWFDWPRATYTPGITKGKEADALPVPAWLMEYLTPMRKPSGLIIISRKGRKAPHPGSTRPALKYANRACSTPGITPHRLRGSYATLLSEQGLPIQTIQALLRNKDYRTTMKYVEKNMDTATRAQDAIAKRAGLSTRR